MIVTAYLRVSKPVRELADKLMVPEKMFLFVRDRVKYEPDPYDRWKLPEETLRDMSGDCEDKAILLASLLLAKDYDAWVRIARVRRIDGSVVYHAWVVYRLGLEWIDLDPSCPKCRPGEREFTVIKYILDFNDKLIRVHDPELAEKFVLR